jgi:hypothetical protein
MIFLAAATHLGRQTWWLRGTFFRFTRTLQSIQTPGHSLTRAGYEQVDGLLRDNPLTSAGWDEFQETVLREEKGETGERSIFNTRPAAEFFPYSAVEQRISAFHRLMPTALTSAGLLGTFIALLIGLHGVHVKTERQAPAISVGKAASESTLQSDQFSKLSIHNLFKQGKAASESTLQSDQPLSGSGLPSMQQPQVVRGIDELINSLSGKFLSSIVALVLAVFYAIWEAWRLRRASDAHHKFWVFCISSG